MVKSRRQAGNSMSDAERAISIEKEAELATNANSLLELIKKVQGAQGIDKDLIFAANQIKDSELRMAAYKEMSEGVWLT